MPSGVYIRTEETKRKMSEAQRGKHLSEDTKRKLREISLGNIKCLGRQVSEKTKKKMSDSHLGKYHSDKTKRKMSEAHSGMNHWNWQGGISFEPYSIDWSESLKGSIRQRDNYTCRLCGKLQKNHHVHHIDYDKKNCNYGNLISLCNSCHIRTNFNRKYWIELFSKIDSIFDSRGKKENEL